MEFAVHLIVSFWVFFVPSSLCRQPYLVYVPSGLVDPANGDFCMTMDASGGLYGTLGYPISPDQLAKMAPLKGSGRNLTFHVFMRDKVDIATVFRTMRVVCSMWSPITKATIYVHLTWRE